ncbi:type 1 glutamine amidotransferase [Thiohalorhabdus methylotrophus]|uniref:Type 1 glutamine amidotransferase n=1 Tax=Thiohalorhabdus methylotrophus TaxID=3242694 RepID=A0ABV4TV91_9GAMM
MKPVLIVRHEDWIESGHLAETLEAEGLPYELCAIDQGDRVPEDPEAYAGLTFMGGTMSVNDGYSWIDDEVALIQRAVERDLPVLGHCFGSQLCAKALGAKVAPMSAKEIGWHHVVRNGDPEVDAWLGDAPREFRVLAWHHDAFELPEGATPLYSSSFCPHQAYVRGNLAATVAHVEVTPELLERWVSIYGYDMDPISETVHSPESVLEDREAKVEAMQAAVTDPLYRRWLGPVRERART